MHKYNAKFGQIYDQNAPSVVADARRVNYCVYALWNLAILATETNKCDFDFFIILISGEKLNTAS